MVLTPGLTETGRLDQCGVGAYYRDLTKVAVLVLFSHHDNDMQDQSSLIWPLTCSGTTVGDLAHDF